MTAPVERSPAATAEAEGPGSPPPVPPTPSPPSPRPAPSPLSDTSAHRVAMALELARRYGTEYGIPPEIAGGVARLCGLGAAEREALVAALAPGRESAEPAPPRAPGPPTAPPSGSAPSGGSTPPAGTGTGTGTESDREADAEAGSDTDTGSDAPTALDTPPAAPAALSAPLMGPGAAPAAPVSAAGDRAAIEAAHRLFDRRRHIRNPAKRLLSEAEVIGLSLLMHGGPEHAEREVTEAELASLDPGDPRRRAYEALVEHNTGLVHEMCKKYVDQGLDYDDLHQYGVLGLMHATCKFNPRLGWRFSTYAFHWVRQSMSRAVADFGSAIRIPVHFHEEIRKVAAVTARLRSEGRPASAGEVAVATGLTITRVREIRRVSRVTDSLDRQLFEGANLGDALSFEHPRPGPEEVLHHSWSREDIESRLLSRLSPKQADILRRRSGLVDGERQTLHRIGDDYQVTRERIRQIETKARRRLREVLEEEAGESERRRREAARGPAAHRPVRPSRAPVARPESNGSTGNTGSTGSTRVPTGFVIAAQRFRDRLGRGGMRERVGKDGTLILCAIADGRLPGDAASTRLRNAVLEWEE
ncbi:sigma-70 family RNA polymerase sigma factor [Streptomyces sp. NPDC001889]